MVFWAVNKRRGHIWLPVLGTSVIKRIKLKLNLLELFEKALQLNFAELNLHGFVDLGLEARVLAICMHIFLDVESEAKFRCPNISLYHISLLNKLCVVVQNRVA